MKINLIKHIILLGLMTLSSTAFSQSDVPQLQRIPPPMRISVSKGANSYAIEHSGKVYDYKATILKVGTNQVAVRVVQTGDYNREDEWNRKIVVIRNYPRLEQLATGESLNPCLCSFIGIETFGEQRLRVYKYLRDIPKPHSP